MNFAVKVKLDYRLGERSFQRKIGNYYLIFKLYN